MLAVTFFHDLASAWERSQDTFWPQALLFVSLTLRDLGLSLLVGVPTGLALTRLPRLAEPVIAVLGMAQTIPSLVLLGLLLPFLGLGQPLALAAAVFYCLFPIVLNIYVGITQVSPAIRDAARGMGMTDRQVLWNVELPLAFPVILAGIRSGAVYATGVIVVSALAGAGGLGDLVYNGISRADDGLIWLGSLPILLLTFLLFGALGGLARLAKKNSALGMSLGGALIVLLSAYAVFGLVHRPGRTEIRIGAKDFTEGQILTEIVKQTIEGNTDLRVEVKSNLGTNLILQAIKRGDIDLYVEYTGNLLTSKDALDLPVPEDKSTITNLVREQMRRRHGLVLLDAFGLNNTYAPTVTRETAQRYRLEKISDLRRVPQLRAVVDQSFMTRPDGWKGLVEKYDLHFDEPPIQVSPNLLYKALDQKKVVIGFATDWQIESLDLVVLADDRGYFPSYHGAPLVRATILDRHPEIGAALHRLADKIDDATMRRLNFEVSVNKRSDADVAREFLVQHNILSK
jgi:osmoprotectant transport system permease protein